MRLGSVPRIKRKLKSFFTNEIVVNIFLLIIVFIFLFILLFGMSSVIYVMSKSIIDVSNLIKSNLLISAIILPLFAKEIYKSSKKIKWIKKKTR